MECRYLNVRFGFVIRALSLILFNGLIQQGSATISIVSQESNSTINSIEENGIETSFAYALQGHLVLSDPQNACKKPAPPPNVTENNATTNVTTQANTIPKWILVATLALADDSCSLSRKAKNAQAAGYSGIIIQHQGANSTDSVLPGFIGLDWVGVKIYTCVVGEHDGELLKNFTYPKKYFVKFENEPAFNAGFLGNITILIFFGLIGFCVCIRGVCYCYSKICFGCEERRRKRRTLLTVNELKKLPIVQWVPELPQETCSICLENFVIKDQVRLLPCSHVFHVACIDAWLACERRKCPNCKRRVIFLREHFSDSESSSTTTDDENEPLLPPWDPSSEHSRFIQALRESPNHRHSLSCSCTPVHTPHSFKGGSIYSETSQQGPSPMTSSDVSVHSVNDQDISPATQSTSTTCLSISQDFSASCTSSEGENDKNIVESEREEELMGKSHSTNGTNEESLSFHSCQEVESDRDELYSSIEQKV